MSYAIVSGASKGIGKAMAIELAKKGFNLLLVARNEAQLQQVAAEVRAIAPNVQVDVQVQDMSAPNAATQLLAYCQSKNYAVSALVNNAGYGLCGNFDQYSIEEHVNMMDLNMTTVARMCHAFLPLLKQQPKAYILNVSGVIAYQALPGMGNYGACKSWVLNFSRALKYELKNTSVSVSVLCPGAVDTDFVNRANITEKALKAAKKVNMSPEAVGKIGIDGMLNGRNEIVAGALNKLSKFLVWLLPKGLVENTAAKIYH
jgi:uncharacterized protein